MRNVALDVKIGFWFQRYRQNIHLAVISGEYLDISVGKAVPAQTKIRFNDMFNSIHKTPKKSKTNGDRSQHPSIKFVNNFRCLPALTL